MTQPSGTEPLSGAVSRLAGTPVLDLRPIGSQFGVRHYRAELADGRAAFVKAVAAGGPSQVPEPPAEAGRAQAELAAEAAGLRWLAEPVAGTAVPGARAGVAQVLGCGGGVLVTGWIDAGPPTRLAAQRFGRELAALHAAGAPCFGAPGPGYIAGLPLPGGPPPAGPPGDPRPAGRPRDPGPDDQRPRGPAASGAVASWPAWYAAARLLPFARRARDAGHLDRADIVLVETVAARLPELAGPSEPPSRIHGDCWSGNVLWSGGRGWLIDPAAHGGHRETDLAMLALFGAPGLEVILAAYAQQAPLAPGWRARVPLHQLHPLLVHVCLFGAAYREQALAACRAALAG